LQHSQRLSPHFETVTGFEENSAFVRIFSLKIQKHNLQKKHTTHNIECLFEYSII